MKDATKPQSRQCQCCTSPLGEPIRVENTERVICTNCLGFIARWWIELGNADRENLNVTAIEVKA